MSDDKLKSDDGKPASRKSAEKKTSTKPKTVVGAKKTTATATKATTPNRKVKSAKAPASKTTTAKLSSQKVVKGAQTKKAADNKSENPKTLQSSKPLKSTATTKTDSKDKNLKSTDKKKTSDHLTAKPENASASRPRKSKSFTKMATVAAVLFLGVLFVFLNGNDPADVEEQSAAKTPSAQVEAPNPNASSPYGMRVEQLKEIELLLSSLNLDPGNIDGDIDHDAVAAISLFQEISGLQVDGRPTPDLLVDLKAVEQLLKIE